MIIFLKLEKYSFSVRGQDIWVRKKHFYNEEYNFLKPKSATKVICHLNFNLSPLLFQLSIDQKNAFIINRKRLNRLNRYLVYRFVSEWKGCPGEEKSTFQIALQIDISPWTEKLCMNRKVIVFQRLCDRKTFHSCIRERYLTLLMNA